MSDEKLYGWMKWGGGQAHGPFDSYKAALEDAQDYLGDDEQVDITINEIIQMSDEDIVHYLPSVDDLIEMASEQFDNNYGCGDEWMFDLHGDKEKAQEALNALLKEWAATYVTTTSTWWMMEGAKITLSGLGIIEIEGDV